MSKIPKSLIAKIQKLFNLADSDRNPSEAEAALALEKAQALLEEHNLSMADVRPIDDPDQSSFDYNRADVIFRPTGSVAVWEKELVRSAALLFDCEVFIDRICRKSASGRPSRGVVWQLVGEEHDVAVAKAAVEYLLQAARRAARERYGSGWTSKHRSFTTGWSTFIHFQAATIVASRAKRRTSQTTALIRIGKHEGLAKWVQDNMKNYSEGAANLGTKVDPEALQAGVEAATGVALNFEKGVE